MNTYNPQISYNHLHQKNTGTWHFISVKGFTPCRQGETGKPVVLTYREAIGASHVHSATETSYIPARQPATKASRA